MTPLPIRLPARASVEAFDFISFHRRAEVSLTGAGLRLRHGPRGSVLSLDGCLRYHTSYPPGLRLLLPAQQKLIPFFRSSI